MDVASNDLILFTKERNDDRTRIRGLRNYYTYANTVNTFRWRFRSICLRRVRVTFCFSFFFFFQRFEYHACIASIENGLFHSKFVSLVIGASFIDFFDASPARLYFAIHSYDFGKVRNLSATTLEMVLKRAKVKIETNSKK